MGQMFPINNAIIIEYLYGKKINIDFSLKKYTKPVPDVSHVSMWKIKKKFSDNKEMIFTVLNCTSNHK